jgi:ubiquinone/menaquinone biosynthesis C-methylase UbiE
MANLFDGPGGWLTAMIMAKANRDAEAEAIEILAPAPDAAVLVIGFGAGVGVALLVERLTQGRVLGVDPSAAMVRAATKRNRAAIAAGTVVLARATAEQVPADDGAFDGAIAVNTLQLCEPIAPTVAELARVLRPGARLVSVTHDWAMARHAGSVERWLAQTIAAFEAAGFTDARSEQARAEKGRAIVLELRRGGG